MFLNNYNISKYVINRYSFLYRCGNKSYCNTNLNTINNINITNNSSNIIDQSKLLNHENIVKSPSEKNNETVATSAEANTVKPIVNKDLEDFYSNQSLIVYLKNLKKNVVAKQDNIDAINSKIDISAEEQIKESLIREIGPNRKVFNVCIKAKPDDIIVFYNDKFNNLELGIVVKANQHGYTILSSTNKFNISNQIHCLTIPTSNETLCQHLRNYIDTMDKEWNLQPYDIYSSNNNNKFNNKFNKNNRNETNTSTENNNNNSSIHENALPKINTTSQHPLSDLFERVNHFIFQLSQYKYNRIDYQSIYDVFSKPYGGSSFFEQKQWSNKQTHCDIIPVRDAAQKIFPEIKVNSDGDIRNSVLNEIFHYLIAFKSISYKSTLFTLIDQQYFSCLSESRSYKLKKLLQSLRQESFETVIVMKYIMTKLNSNGHQIPRNSLRLLTDRQIPTLLDHNDFLMAEDNKPYRNVPKLKQTFNDILTIFKELQSYTFLQEFGATVKNNLINPYGIKNSHQKAILNVFLGNHFNIAESKLTTHTNFAIENSHFLRNKINQQIKVSNAKYILEESFTIDSTKTKDVDDAVGIIKDGDDIYCIVHIADVSSSFEPFSSLDSWGQLKSSSIYLPEKTYFMLPSDVTYGLSLEPNRANKCLSFKFKIDENGDITNTEIFSSTVENIKKTNYQEVDNYLDKSNNHSFSVKQQAMLDYLYDIALKRKTKREVNALSVNIPKPELVVEDGRIKFVHPNFTSKSNVIVSELMISANYVAAQYAAQTGIPIPFRTQKKSDLSEFNPTYFDKYHPLALAFESTTYLGSASMSTVDKSHFGLGIDYYTWATSPIRRYSDILVHRQIKNMLEHKAPLYQQHYLDQFVDPLNRNLKMVKKIQKDSINNWTYKYFAQEGPRYYNAVQLPNTTEILGTKFMLVDVGMNVVSHDEAAADLPTNEVVQIYADRDENGKIVFLKDKPKNEKKFRF